MALPSPAALGRASTDPVGGPPQARRPTPVPATPTHAPQVSSVAMPRHGRRWGVVIAILLIDAGLATAGGVLLMQGLKDDPPAPAPAPTPTAAAIKTSQADGPATVAAPAAPVPMKIEKAKVKARSAPSPPPPPPPKVAKGKPAKGKPVPVDPYPGSAAPIQDDEDHSGAISDAIDTKSSHAEGIFSRCYTQATKPLPADQPLKGRIMIAFTVLSNGHVGNVTTAENQTGSDQLANCLASEIGGWIFSDHPQDPIEITKIFAFGPSSS